MRSIVCASMALVLMAWGTGTNLADGVRCGTGEEGFIPIFDGRSMAGWDVLFGVPGREVPRPDAFVVEDGAFRCQGLKKYWLRYKAEKLDDFVLRFEYKLSQGANSGVCIHAQDEGVPWQTGFEVQILDDYGQEPDLHSTGAIYDVICPMYNESKPAGEWNEMEVTSIGKQVKVAVNGMKVIDADFGHLTVPMGKYKKPFAELPSTGYITFQDHGKVWWLRNVRVKKLKGEARTDKPAESRASDEAFTTILDGTSLEGWSAFSPGGDPLPTDGWVLKDGYLHCSGQGSGFFRYEKEPLADVVVRGEFRIPPRANSGIILRSKKTGDPCYNGFEIQVYDDYGKKPYRTCCGSVYDIATPMFNSCKPAGEWNMFEITVDGLLVKVVLNGWKIIDTDFSKLTRPRGKFNFAYADLPRSGYLCFQDHGSEVDYRNIRIKKIRP